MAQTGVEYFRTNVGRESQDFHTHGFLTKNSSASCVLYSICRVNDVNISKTYPLNTSENLKIASQSRAAAISHMKTPLGPLQGWKTQMSEMN